MSDEYNPEHWLLYWFSQGEEAVSYQEGWNQWWQCLGDLNRTGGFRSRQQILCENEPDPATLAYLERFSNPTWSSAWPLFGSTSYIPLIGIEFADFSLWDIKQGRAVFCASQGHWRYLENRRYRDMYSETYALSPRQFLVSVCDDDEDFRQAAIERATGLNLAALLLKSGMLADPSKSVVTQLREKGGLNRTGGLVFRSYSWSFQHGNEVNAFLQSKVEASDDRHAEDTEQEHHMGSDCSVETTKLTTSKYAGEPVVITASEFEEFLFLLDLVDYARGYDLFNDAEDFALRCYLGFHDLWHDDRYKFGLLFSCFEAVIGRLSARNRNDCVAVISGIAASNGQTEIVAETMFNELIEVRHKIAHGSMDMADAGSELAKQVVELLRHAIRMVMFQKCRDFAEEELPEPKSTNYFKRLQRKLAPRPTNS